MTWHQLFFGLPGSSAFVAALFKCDGCGLNRSPLFLGRNPVGTFVTLRCSHCRGN